MRRYAVRFLVAVLTFGIGVAFSLFLGLFRFQEAKSTKSWIYSNSRCSKTVVARPAMLRVDTELGDPLKLSYLRPASEGMKILVENRRDQAISGYSLRGKRLWSNNGRAGETSFTWNSDRVLRPGETSVITLPPNTEGLSVLVDEVTFESGFTWVNPRR